MEIGGRPRDSEGDYGDAEFRHRADAVRETFPGWRRGAYCAAHRREGAESCGRGCADSGARIRGILYTRQCRETAGVFGNVLAACLEGAAFFVVDDFDAALIPQRQRVRSAAASGGTGLCNELARRTDDARGKLRRPSIRLSVWGPDARARSLASSWLHPLILRSRDSLSHLACKDGKTHIVILSVHVIQRVDPVSFDFVA